MIGRVLAAHVDDRFVLDAERRYIDTPALNLVARMHASGAYLRSGDLFHMERPSWEQRRGREAAAEAAEEVVGVQAR